MTYQVEDVTKPVNSVSKMCDAGKVVTSTAEGSTIKNLWTRIWSSWVKKGIAWRNGVWQVGNVIPRVSRAVSPMLDHVSDEEDVQAIEENTSDGVTRFPGNQQSATRRTRVGSGDWLQQDLEEDLAGRRVKNVDTVRSGKQ